MSAGRGPWMQTYSGLPFWPMDPRPEDIRLADVAHALANLARFNGHARQFYSVAQHSVCVCWSVPSEDRRWGLLHDASEAYVGDMILPMKASGLFDNFLQVEARVVDAVRERFELPPRMPDSVKEADKRWVVTEARDLFEYNPEAWHLRLGFEPYERTVKPWGPEEAERRFLKMCERYDIT